MKKFVDSYCNYLQKKRIFVSNEQWEICAYGLELIVSAVLNIVILVMCSVILHEERYADRGQQCILIAPASFRWLLLPLNGKADPVKVKSAFVPFNFHSITT